MNLVTLDFLGMLFQLKFKQGIMGIEFIIAHIKALKGSGVKAVGMQMALTLVTD